MARPPWSPRPAHVGSAQANQTPQLPRRAGGLETGSRHTIAHPATRRKGTKNTLRRYETAYGALVRAPAARPKALPSASRTERPRFRKTAWLRPSAPFGPAPTSRRTARAAELRRLLSPEVTRLEAIIDRDLGAWKT